MNGRETTGQIPAEEDPGRATHLFFGLCVTICVGFLIWAFFGVLDIVSVAVGEVIPSSQVKTVQHLEGGIVREIMVREGENVKKGQPLVTLETTTSGADLGELRVKATSLKIEAARLEAEIDGLDEPVFPEELKKTYPGLIDQAKNLFEARKTRRRSQLAAKEQAVIQRREQIREISGRLVNTKEGLRLQNKQIDINKKLFKNKLITRYVQLDFLKEASRLKGLVDADEAGLKRAWAALNEAKADLQNTKSTIEEENRKKLEENRIMLGELTQRMQKFEDNLKRTVLRSPVDGVVKTLYTSTVGGVVKAGSPVVDIVPAGDRLVIEARLPTQDIGYIKAGQPVMVKLASSDGRRFGGIDGEVVNVSPDTLITKEGKPYYKVRIETEKSKFQRGELEYRLFPGMQVVTSIRTGTRTVMEYLLGSFLNSAGDAMRER